MKQLRVEEVRSIALGWRLSPGIDTMVTGVSTDSRTARPGDAFIAIKGEKFDGHDYLAQASQAGCVLAVVQREAGVDKDLAESFPGGVIGVADPIRALADIAEHQRKTLSATVVAVTGSNGKTTVKNMIHHILSRRLEGLSSPKSYNNEVGVPVTLLATDGTEDYVVCELGTNAPGEIANLARICEPDVAVITSISPAHLEKLGTLERIASEKTSVLGALKPRGLGIINGDYDLLQRSAKAYERRVVTFGESPGCALRLTAYESQGLSGCTYELNGRLKQRLALPGKHNALNALAAIAAAQRFGFSQDESAEALESFRGVGMRWQIRELAEITLVNDAYNANPASLRGAAEILAGFGPRRRKVMVVGDMLELGQQGPDLHKQMGKELADLGIDVVVGVGDLGGLVAESAGQAGANAAQLSDTQAAAEAICDLLVEGDVVVLKGSRAMALETLVEPIVARFGPEKPAPTDS
jgi:UDP-N-acetylmuramoyl-tripeptide--D-alanyl-D-alanine ligase